MSVSAILFSCSRSRFAREWRLTTHVPACRPVACMLRVFVDVCIAFARIGLLAARLRTPRAGSFGCVYKCKVKGQNRYVAVKIVDIDTLGDLAAVQEEIENLQLFGGGDVVSFFDAVSQTDSVVAILLLTIAQ